jgi:hypothetical protein
MMKGRWEYNDEEGRTTRRKTTNGPRQWLKYLSLISPCPHILYARNRLASPAFGSTTARESKRERETEQERESKREREREMVVAAINHQQ